MSKNNNADKKEQIARISELANKTNQFICNYKRYSEGEVEKLMNDENSIVISTKLEDKLSDSGIIGVCVLKNNQNHLEMEECFISCRALGRGIDDNIVFFPIKLALDKFSKTNLKINFTKGERNKPAQNFLEENLAEFINNIATFNKKINQNTVTINIEE